MNLPRYIFTDTCDFKLHSFDGIWPPSPIVPMSIGHIFFPHSVSGRTECDHSEADGTGCTNTAENSRKSCVLSGFCRDRIVIAATDVTSDCSFRRCVTRPSTSGSSFLSREIRRWVNVGRRVSTASRI